MGCEERQTAASVFCTACQTLFIHSCFKNLSFICAQTAVPETEESDEALFRGVPVATGAFRAGWVLASHYKKCSRASKSMASLRLVLEADLCPY